MALLWRVLTVVVLTLARALALWLVLFAVYLLAFRGWPHLKHTAELLELQPLVEQRLTELRAEIARARHDEGRFERQLSELGAERMRTLELQAADLAQRVSLLTQERDRLASELQSLTRERDEACASFNPFKRWACAELERRHAALDARLAPAVQALETQLVEASRLAQRVSEDLRALADPSLTPEQRAARLGPEATERLLSVGVTRARVEQLGREVAELDAKLRHLQQLEATPLGWLLSEWRAVRVRLLWLVAAVLLAPYLQRALNYYALMPLVTRWGRGIRLAELSSGQIRVGPAQHALPLRLTAGETLRVRAAHARPVEGNATSQLLYDWRAPLVSYAAGLRLLTRLEGDEAGVAVTLASPDDPNSRLVRVDLDDHPGLSVHPRNVVGVIGAPRLQTKWRLGHLHAWSTWQLRYILFTGTGSILLEGRGDLVTARPADRSVRIERELVVGFDARTTLSTARTETFLPYLLGQSHLVDARFVGSDPVFWQTAPRARAANPVARTFEALLSALGKLLGF